MNFILPINEHIQLALRHEGDAEVFFEIVDRNREEFKKWLPWVDKTVSAEDTKKFLLEC